MSDLVGNPEDTFSHNEAQTGVLSYRKYSTIKRLCNILHFFTAVNMIIFSEAVLTSTPDLCFRAKIRKKYTSVFKTPVLLYKSGMSGV